MNAQQLFGEGKLDEAVEAMNAEVRSHPADPDKRAFLADLLCITGNFERVDVQMEAIAKLLPGAAGAVALVRQLVRAEQWRQQCFTEGRVPEFLGPPDERVQQPLRALLLAREGDAQGAAELLGQAEASRRPPSGRHGGQAFDEFRDCDDVCAGMFEVLTSTGKYLWVPMERVSSVRLRPVLRPRDLIWRRAEMLVRDGPEGEVFLPAIYAPAPDDAAARLGRLTEWSPSEPVRGRGLRTFLVGEEPVTLMELQELEFDAPAA